MKRLFAALILMLVTIWPAAAKTSLAVIMNEDDKGFYQVVLNGLNKAAPALDADLTITYSNNDPRRQEAQIGEALAAKPAALIMIALNAQVAQMAVDSADHAGIPLVFMIRRPDLTRIAGQLSMVSSNDLVAGRLQMRLLADRLNGQGNIIILRGPDDRSASIQRVQGMKEVLAAYPGLKLIKEASLNWSKPDEAEKQMTAWLAEGVQVNGVAAANDMMALGALAALKSAGQPPGSVAIGGVDGLASTVAAIKAGDIAVSIKQDGATIAATAIANAVAMASGHYAAFYDWIPYQPIIPDNVDRFLGK